MGFEENCRNGTDFNVLVFIKDGEKYVFLYDDSNDSKAETLRMLGRFASNEDLSFEWSSAAELSNVICGTRDRYPIKSRFNFDSLIKYNRDRGYCFLVKSSKLGRTNLGMIV